MEAIYLVTEPRTLLTILVASIYGLFVGAIPGLTATMAAALLVPFTFFMEPLPAMAAIVAMEAMAIFAGDIPAALVRMPGTPSSAAYTDDSYALTKQGRLGKYWGRGHLFSHWRSLGGNMLDGGGSSLGRICHELYFLRVLLAGGPRP